MTLFLSTYTNKIDRKGRVSVPSQFRASLNAQEFQGVVLVPSMAHSALEGFSWSYMEGLSRRVDEFDLFSDTQDDLAAVLFSESVPLQFDGDGRIVLSSALMNAAGLSDQAAFVGMGQKFQIWDPEHLKQRQEEARRRVSNDGLTVPKRGAAHGGDV